MIGRIYAAITYSGGSIASGSFPVEPLIPDRYNKKHKTVRSWLSTLPKEERDIVEPLAKKHLKETGGVGQKWKWDLNPDDELFEILGRREKTQ